jgi:4-diphosphocytidyl-2-C-methyl-D-erythritol kinase
VLVTTTPAAALASLSVPAPAKLNLFLHVLGRRADGYHELETLFVPVDVCDTVTVTRVAGTGARLAAGSGGPREGNLAQRALAALLAASGATDAGLLVHVTKRIPQGGLGGGSSDAAAALLAGNALLGAPLDDAALERLGLALGADVPFFVRGLPALAGGVGERLQPVAVPPACFVIVQPDCEVPTPAVFGHPALTRSGTALTMRGFLEIEAAGSASFMATMRARTRNDCEALVRSLHPPVDHAFRWLAERAPARLTGTGGCVFAEVGDEATGRALAATVPAPWRGIFARAMRASPAREAVAAWRQPAG